MSTKLEALQAFLSRMHLDYGYQLVCVGGAARDTYLGREPKDYDLAVLTPVQNVDAFRTAIFEASGATGIEELGKEDIEDYVSEGNDRGLLHVLEFMLDLDPNARADWLPSAGFIKVQVLVFNVDVTTRYAGDPYNVVEDHDCDLSKAWFEEVGGRLVARVHPEFPSPFAGNVNHFKPGLCNEVRKRYIKEKFPEYQHR